MGRLDGKKALVTGAASGIGLACARMMAGEGAAVTLSDINETLVSDQAASLTKEHPGRVFFCRHDVTREDQWTDAVAYAENAMEGLNVLVNSAGICRLGTVTETDPDTFRQVIDTDLTSVFLGCRAALGRMRGHAPGSIVNISSISGLVAGHNLAAYNAAKAGVWLMTKSVALQAAREGMDVRANTVHPAFVDTGMLDEIVGGKAPEETRKKLAAQVPLGRIGTAEDVAYAVVYLASDESRFMTGAELKLDGGLSAQ